MTVTLAGCQSLRRGDGSKPPAPTAVEPQQASQQEELEPAPASPGPDKAGLAPPVLERIESGERQILAGEWRAAAATFDGLLGLPADGHLDRILLRSALIRLHPKSPLRRPSTGYAFLERLVAELPESFYAAEAATILTLRREQRSLAAEVDRLRAQLDELRRIDLEPPPGQRD